ncbi:MAG: Radical SAM domain protein [Candidatus Uhrbacteria bacterium GW2011_GWF2_39_13]|uniref:Radical SAM domain protein n=1 Tax=Candidatus Uhrbacteria bacterium GW2011_GWF2_39_13 TaxID=1618995 RepID=A0A0G0QQF8_9BACT|nr:MAG: Radical SAM domain protein [Candidatus Uhrbacteria bacterium GW2011_GWF2_39_13]
MNCKFRQGPVVLVSRKIQYVFPLAYAYLAAYLKQHGEHVIILFKEYPPEKMASLILELNPLLVGFGNLYPELKETADIISILNKRDRQFPVVIGGQMVSPTPEFAVKITGADFGITGEGEITLHKLVLALREAKDPLEIKGLAVRQGNDVIMTGPGEFIEDISQLPKIPYELFPADKWLPIGKWYAGFVPNSFWHYDDRVVNIHGGRGCPFNCNFCYHHSKPRYRSIESMMAEASEYLDKFDANILYFSDDTVLMSPNRAKELVKGIRQLNRKVKFSVSTRFDIIARMDDNLLNELHDAGCIIMGLGFESGSDRILDIIGKNFTVDVMLSGVERLKKAGILPTGNIMVGQYTETAADVEASIQLMKRSLEIFPQMEYSFSLCTPFPGSALYNMIMEKGLLKDDQDFYNKFFSGNDADSWKLIVNLSAMTDKQVHEMYSKLTHEYTETKKRLFSPLLKYIYYSQIAYYRLWRISDRVITRILPGSTPSGIPRSLVSGIYDCAQRYTQKINWKLRKLDSFLKNE